jgi:hypothetical protein
MEDRTTLLSSKEVTVWGERFTVCVITGVTQILSKKGLL